MHIIIGEEFKDWRLDKFLVKNYPDLSRAQIQKAIAAGKIQLNNKKIPKHCFLRVNDVITGSLDEEIQLAQTAFTLQPNPKIKLNIIFEDDNYLVIDKPANLIVHPSQAHLENDTLINGVLAHCPEVINIGEDKMRPGIVHRLDKEVSGLLVIPKTPIAFLSLKNKFASREIYKEYIALAHGKFTEKHGFIDFAIARSKTTTYKMAAKPDDSGKEALTEYEVIKDNNHYTLLKIILHTGRTHQIRVHLNAIGHPIVGDEIYRPKNLKSNLQLHRIFLHAKKIKFKNLLQEEKEFVAELPEELKKILEKIKISL